MNGGKSRGRKRCLHRDMIGYDWLCSAVIGSCDKSHLLCTFCVVNQSE